MFLPRPPCSRPPCSRPVAAKAPPIKIQGIKTKLVPPIAAAIAWDGAGRWVEPFLGSGAVALNLAPPRALLADSNPHLIAFYRAIQTGALDGARVRAHLEREGATLSARGAAHYYAVRARFNAGGASGADPLDFLFLNRACFNGLMRFNRQGGFNVPFCHKPDRFRPAMVTRIVNQVEWARRAMAGKDWTFAVQDWRATLAAARPGDMVYCDPPYAGRHADYYNAFSEGDTEALAGALHATPAAFALSHWLENRHLRKPFVERWFAGHAQRRLSHAYHLGARESLRGEMTEVLVLSPGAAAPGEGEGGGALPAAA